MKFLVFILSIILFNSSLAQHYSANDIQLISEVDKVLKENHVDYDRVYPHVSSRIAKGLLNELDPESEYLTEKEVARINLLLSNFKLDGDFTNNALEEIIEIYENRLHRTLDILTEIKHVNFFAKDSISVSIKSDTIYYVSNNEELKTYWERRLKLQVLSRHKNDSLTIRLSKDRLNSFLNEKLDLEKTFEACKIETFFKEQNLSKQVLNAYLKAYCKSFDSHSNFFLPEEEDDFLNSLASEFYGTGITFGQNGANFYVKNIQPFSYASTKNEIRVGDEITGVVVDGKLVSPACLSTNELNILFYGDDDPTLELELKSFEDKQYRRFKLVKSVVNSSTNHTYSFILSNEDIDIGYIQFPSFYVPFGANGRSSAQDLALILIEMKKHEVNGIIIDLRNNGGGSIREAADILGYFIDYGPLFTVVTQQNQEGILMKDTKKGKLIDVKVIFLVNALSASASEIVAAVMQEYPSALVVGSPTFGKATGQILIPIKTQHVQKSEGTVVVTDLKVFRFNGTTYQGEGVVPDIILPTFINKSFFSETNYSYVLKLGEARKFRQLAFRNEPIDSLNFLARERGSLSRIDSLSKLLADRFASPHQISLNYNEYSNIFPDLMDNDLEINEGIEIESMEDNAAFLKESGRIKAYEEKDPILNEVFLIFQDWIQITNTK